MHDIFLFFFIFIHCFYGTCKTTDMCIDGKDIFQPQSEICREGISFFAKPIIINAKQSTVLLTSGHLYVCVDLRSC